MSKLNQLQKKIMRRVYYAFALRLGTHPLVVHGALLVASVYGLSVMIHVSSILETIRNMQVGNLDTYIFNAFTHTDVFTLLFVGLVFFTLLSLRWSLRVPRWNDPMQTA